MRLFRVLCVGLLVGGAFVAIQPAADAASKPIRLECGLVIDSPGRYVATGSTGDDCPDNHVIEITSSRVTLDLRGFRVDGDGDNIACIFVAGPLTKVSISNGVVTDCTDGVTLMLVTKSSVAGMSVEGNADNGIVMSSTVGALSSGNVLSRNTVVNNGGIGVQATGPGFLVTRNVVVGNDDTGIRVGNAGGRGPRITKNSSISNASNGIHANGSGPFVLTGNVTTSNGDVGINLDGPATTIGNTSEWNTKWGFIIAGLDARHTFKGNVAIGNGIEGIVVSNLPATVNLVKNTANGNLSDGITLEVAHAGITLSKNSANDNGAVGIDADSAPNQAKGANNTATGNGVDNCQPTTLC